MRRQILSALALVAFLSAGCTALPSPVPPVFPSPTVETLTVASTSATATSVATSAAESPLATPVLAVQATPTGTVSATGRVLTDAGGTRQPLPNTPLRLARVIWNADKSDGAFVLEGGTSPIATTDAAGAFTFYNVTPGDYVVVVGDPYTKNEIISKPDGKARIYTIPAEGAPEFGDIVVKLAP